MKLRMGLIASLLCASFTVSSEELYVYKLPYYENLKSYGASLTGIKLIEEHRGLLQARESVVIIDCNPLYVYNYRNNFDGEKIKAIDCEKEKLDQFKAKYFTRLGIAETIEPIGRLFSDKDIEEIKEVVRDTVREAMRE